MLCATRQAADTLTEDSRSAAQWDTEKWLESWSHKCWQTQSFYCDRSQKVVTMDLFGFECCESDTLLLSSTDSLDELQSTCFESESRGSVLSFVHVETDVVTHAHHC